MPKQEPSHTSLKNRFPFRIGTTSYIIPDEVIPNIRFLAQQVDDVELVLFESDKMSNIPNPEQVNELKTIADDNGLTYTVHLPLDTRTGSVDETVRRVSTEKYIRVVERMSPLDPFAFVCHLHGDQRGHTPANDIPAWVAQHSKSVEELLAHLGPHDLCIETLDYPYELVEDIVFDNNLAVCMDIGHIIVNGHSLPDYFDRYFSRTRIIHLHGVENGRDHTHLGHLDKNILDMVMNRLISESKIQRVCTLEIFSRENFDQSVAVLQNTPL